MNRTTVTILFTDLVGSTELRGRLGEEAADDLRRKHDQLLAQAVEGNNGRVVKGLGDGIMATFGGASDAVAASVAIQQAVDRLNRSGKAALPVAVRVGLSAGDVAFEDEDVHGTPVIEASRLCAAAGASEILAAEVVRILAGSTGGHNFLSVGPLELKGLDHPVAVMRVQWEPVAVSTIPMPALLTDIGRIFVGRDAELERLNQLWKEAAAGERRVTLLAGEPGVGKTRLAAELAITVHGQGGVVLAGRCDEDLGVPYQPFVEMLRHFVDHAPAAELPASLGRYGGELTRLVPELAAGMVGLPAPLRSDPETERYRLFDAVAAWLAAAAADEPLLLVLDDLQWAAKPTLLLLRHILRRPDARRLLIVGTYRDTELTHDHPLVELMADLRRDGTIERLPISGLDDTGVAAFVERAAGQALDDDGIALARAIHQETEGNPFFVREVLRHLAETNVIGRDGDRWTTRVPIDQLGIPDGVREVVGRRLARLSADANQLLRAAAVVGPEFEMDVVRAAADMRDSEVLAALDEAVEARLVSETTSARFRFSHAVVRATLYESLSGARKVMVHRLVAEALEALHEGALDNYLPALAHHWARASAPAAETGKAVDYAIRAGDRALAQLAHDEAANYYAAALELLDAGGTEADVPRRLELLISRGEAQRRAGDPGYRETLLAAARLARQLGDARALARAVLANTRGHIWNAALRVDAERVEALEVAIAAVGEDDLPLQARLLATLGLELAWEFDPTRRLTLSGDALRIAGSLGDPATLAHVLLARDYTITGPENVAERFAATATVLEAAEQIGDPVLASRALSLRFKAAMELADVAEAERALARNRLIVADLGQPALTWATMHHDATLRVLRCERDAEAAVTAAYELGLASSEQQAEIGIWSMSQRKTLLWDSDRLHEFEAWAGQIAQRFDHPVVKGIRAAALVETGQKEAAKAVFDDVVATDFAHPTNNVGWLMFVSECAWACAGLGRSDCVPRLRSMLAPYADQLVVGSFAGWVTGPVALFLGRLCATVADWSAAEAYFGAAAATQERIRAPSWLARTRVEWARMLLTRRQPGDADRTRELVDQALADARELRLANVERRAVELLS